MDTTFLVVLRYLHRESPEITFFKLHNLSEIFFSSLNFDRGPSSSL